MPNGTIVVELQKALYGCVESSKLWYDLIVATLESIGFARNPVDPCVLNKMKDGVQCTVVIYVDDLMVTSKDSQMIDEVMNTLKTKFQGIEVHDGPVFSYLGLSWDFSIPGEVKVTADGYTEELLRWADITGTAQSPAAYNLFDTRDVDKLDPDKAEWFHSGVAKLLYLAKRTRPDILLPVSFLTTRVQCSNQDDLNKLLRVLRYLNGTRDLGVILRPDPNGNTLSAFIDASYGVHEDGKSHTGMMISFGAGPLLVKSSKQKIVTKSSTEAELIALSDMCSPVIWSRDFLVAQGIDPPPATVYQDNMSTIALADRGGSNSDRTRHVKIRRFWMKDRVADGEINIVYKPTEDMIADILTKPLQGAKFTQLRQLLLNWSY
jgi:histone deacetylase 1/2